jgi:hypothetical protein
MAESPVRVYYGEDPRLAQSVIGRLRQEITDRASQVARGLAGDWGDYQRRVGVIEGLNEAVKIAEQAEKDLRGEPDARLSKNVVLQVRKYGA